MSAEGFDASEDGTGRGTPLIPTVADPISASEQSTWSHAGNNAGKTHNLIAFDTTQITSKENRSNPQPGDPCHPLASGAHAPAIAVGIDGGDVAFALRAGASHSGDKGDGGMNTSVAIAFSPLQGGRSMPCGDISPTLESGTGNKTPGVALEFGVRRLTPLECLRLMGWPDDHFDGLGFSDSTKYRACGNGVVSNVAEWIGRRIVKAML